MVSGFALNASAPAFSGNTINYGILLLLNASIKLAGRRKGAKQAGSPPSSDCGFATWFLQTVRADISFIILALAHAAGVNSVI
jgi:hypothetical protein